MLCEIEIPSHLLWVYEHSAVTRDTEIQQPYQHYLNLINGSRPSLRRQNSVISGSRKYDRHIIEPITPLSLEKEQLFIK